MPHATLQRRRLRLAHRTHAELFRIRSRHLHKLAPSAPSATELSELRVQTRSPARSPQHITDVSQEQHSPLPRAYDGRFWVTEQAKVQRDRHQLVLSGLKAQKIPRFAGRRRLRTSPRRRRKRLVEKTRWPCVCAACHTRIPLRCTAPINAATECQQPFAEVRIISVVHFQLAKQLLHLCITTCSLAAALVNRTKHDGHPCRG